MREIKFRVWDKLIKKMITDGNVKKFLGENFGSWNKNQPYDWDEWYPAYEILAIFRYFKDIVDYTIDPYEPKSEKRFKIMQYTGLKDKNSVEIYEGDIVYVASEDEKAMILWDKESARFVLQFKDWCADFDIYYEKDLEVVGNIYDNPELLENT